MSKLTETLKDAGWVETTLGECRMGEDVLVMRTDEAPRAMRVIQPAERGVGKGPFVSTSDGCVRRDTTPVLREPRPKRPECEPGTVALITWDEGYGPVRDLLPVRAMMSVEGVWHGAEIDPPGESDRIEVVRVLLPADQDTPPITDEMVERAAEACYIASFKEDAFGRQWDKACERFPDAADLYRREARAVLKAALGDEKDK